MRGGHRNMYYATGMPGWMRLGYSPGWVGRSPTGLPPTAAYLMTGAWQTPQPQAQAQAQGIPAGMPVIPTEQEIPILESHVAMLEQQLGQIKKRIEELKR